jgi:hypothetical protein
MEPYLDLDDARRTLDGTSTASFATHWGGYAASSVPKQTRVSYWNQEFSRAVAIVHTLCSSVTTLFYCTHATRPFPLTRDNNDGITPEN